MSAHSKMSNSQRKMGEKIAKISPAIAKIGGKVKVPPLAAFVPPGGSGCTKAAVGY
jgi:hypothetical protein